MAQEVATTNNAANAVAPVSVEIGCMSLVELKKRAEAVSNIKKQIMKDGIHYGVVPGCGNKPTLLKNGAELLCMAFGLASDVKAEISELGNGHREYTITTTLTSGGVLVATGIGSCSTLESKYRYRNAPAKTEDTGKPVPKDYWNDRDVNLIGGKGFKAVKNAETGSYTIHKVVGEGGKVENPDIADQYNTCLKMASKRSLVDAILKATGGSCEFTQDLEDGNVNAAPYNSASRYGSTKKGATAKDESADLSAYV